MTKSLRNLKQFCAWAGLVNCLFILMPTCTFILAQGADPKCLVDFSLVYPEFSPGVASVPSMSAVDEWVFGPGDCVALRPGVFLRVVRRQVLRLATL